MCSLLSDLLSYLALLCLRLSLSLSLLLSYQPPQGRGEDKVADEEIWRQGDRRTKRQSCKWIEPPKGSATYSQGGCGRDTQGTSRKGPSLTHQPSIVHVQGCLPVCFVCLPGCRFPCLLACHCPYSFGSQPVFSVLSTCLAVGPPTRSHAAFSHRTKAPTHLARNHLVFLGP